MSTRILVCDDQALVRAGFRKLLESVPDFLVVGEAVDGEDAIRQARRELPDVVLMDLRMPRIDGIAATEHIVAECGDAVRILVLTTFSDDDNVFQSLRAGASGFLLKDAPPEDLITAIRTIASGHALLSPAVTRSVIREFVRAAPTTPRATRCLDRLTPRELTTLQLLASGMSNAEIAQHLVVSETTVKTHVGHLLAKLELRDRVQAVVLAYESGLAGTGEA